MKSFFIVFSFLILVFQLKAQTFTGSNLPIVIINTGINPNNGLPYEIMDDPKIIATMKIIYRPDGSRNYLTDKDSLKFLSYNGNIGIETKGSTSQNLAKKPYGFTTLKADKISNNNVSILGMPEENDWILNSLPYDETLIRDYISYDLARSMGNYAARLNYCEVVLNNEYIGLYMLSEKLKINSKRIDIAKLSAIDNLRPGLTGGYVTKCDKTTGGDPIAWSFTTNIFNNVDFIHENPKPSEITSTQNSYIFNEFKTLDDIMIAQNSSISTGFPSKIDIPSFVDFMIMNELASNVDGYQLSTYFHKDRRGKLRAGPIWDFNLAYGLDVFGDRSQTNVWQFDNGDNVGAKFWNNLYQNSTYKCYLQKRWEEVTSVGKPLNYDTVIAKIDKAVSLISEAKEREHEKWGTVFDQIGKVNEMKDWLQLRYDWINANLGSSSSCTFPTPAPLVISKINYNPAPYNVYSSNDLEFIEISNNSNSAINISGYYFRDLGLSYVFPRNSSLVANGKIFLASDSVVFRNVMGFAPFGEFSRNLSNKSQKITLADPYGNIVDQVEYADSSPWPLEADGKGSCLSLTNLNSDNAIASNWTFTNQILTNIQQNHIQTNYLIYPNPTQGKVHIRNSDLGIINVEVFDLLGKLVFSNDNIKSMLIEIDLKNLASSTYIFKITNREKVSSFHKIGVE